MQDQFPRDPDRLAPPENVTPSSGRSRGRPADWVTGGLIVLVLLFGGLWVYDVARDDELEGPGLGVALADVAQDPERFAGQRLTLSGVVRERFSDQLFMLGDEGVLVVAPRGTLLPEDAVVQVEGMMSRTTRGDLAQDLTMLEGDSGFDRLGDGEVWVLHATSIVVNPFVDDEGLPVPQGDAFDAEGVMSVDRLIRNFDALEGQEVTVAGELSVTVVPHVALFEGMLYEIDNLLIVSEREAIGSFPATVTARATGTLIRFNTRDIEEQFGISLDEDMVSEYEGHPTLLVSEIHYFLRDPLIATAIFDIVEIDVTVTTTVTEVLGDGLFTVSDGGALVIAGAGEAPEEGARIRITGQASILDEAGLREALGEDRAARLSDEQLGELEGRPVIRAETVEPLQ